MLVLLIQWNINAQLQDVSNGRLEFCLSWYSLNKGLSAYKILLIDKDSIGILQFFANIIIMLAIAAIVGLVLGFVLGSNKNKEPDYPDLRGPVSDLVKDIRSGRVPESGGGTDVSELRKALADWVPEGTERELAFRTALRRMHREAARRQREAAEAAAEANDDSGGSDSEADRGMIETERVLDPEDFKRIKALKTANQLAAAMARGGAKKASATAEAEMRAMLRRADRAGLGDAADRRVDPDSLAAVGVRKAHDKASRVASIMAGREDRGQFGAASERKNKKTGGTSNAEKAKRKNLPLAARVKAAKNRRNSFVSKRVKDKQFKGRFRR